MRIFFLALASALLLSAQPAVRWVDARELGIEGKGWKETSHPYDRLPAKAEGVVRAPWSEPQN